ncbi:MAG: peptidoglycan DD-metalloendopeptidase family protein [Oscillospiraceae bacterium]|nr:peptidoglycan DD-metalloendopeptidase family protein [Oscillospiraceae bacterium]
MEEKSKSGLGSFLSGKGFYIVLVLCVVAIGISGYILLFTGNGVDTIPSNEVTAGDYDTVYAPPVVDLPSVEADSPVFDADSTDADAPAESVDLQSGAIFVSAPVEETPPSDSPADTDSAPRSGAESSAPAEPEGSVDAGIFKNEEPVWVWPVANGHMGAPWVTDRLVFNETLGDWRVHDGMDINCAAGAEIMAPGSGVVSRIYTDALYGVCVEIDHKNGFVSTLCNLTEEVDVSVGDAVNPSQVIGRAGATAQAEQGAPHLHLKLTRDGQSVDPAEYLK